MRMTDVNEGLKQIAHGNGVDAGDLISKDVKKALHDAGMVWAAYGSKFHLTPRGKAFAEWKDIEVAPFAWLSAEELTQKAEACWDTEWDKRRGKEWLSLALNTNFLSRGLGETP